MSDVSWKIDGTDLAALGLTLAGGSFRTQGVSHCALDAALEFDAAQAFDHGDEVTLQRVDGMTTTPFFRGKVRRIPKSARGDYEGHAYVIEDAWADLETTVYQEKWRIGSGLYDFPRFVMGVGVDPETGLASYLTTGPQIERFLQYAIDQGVSLQIGSIPTGDRIIPSEERNVTVAEAIRMCLRFRPDWTPWIDHATTPPTFHVTDTSTLAAVSLAVDGSGPVTNFDVTKRDEDLPESVRIIYELAGTIVDEDGDNQVLRDAAIDKYPAEGPDGGPRVLVSTIQLEGLQMQIQKQRIQTRVIPTGPSDPAAKAWIKAKFPHMADVPDAAFNVTKFDRSLITDATEHADPVNPNAERIEVEAVADLPRELVRGQIEDWMRVKVGEIKIAIEIEKAGDWSAATAEARKAWKKGVRDIQRMTATNARTKIYRGISNWVLPEDVPTGIAQAVYQAIHAGSGYEGSVTLTEDEVGGARYHGKKLNLTGSADAGLETMAAPVHSVDWDIETGTTTIGFGPNPDLSPQDFLEWQRILRARPLTWWSLAERESNEHGRASGSSSRGDSVGGYDFPASVPDGGDKPAGDNPFSLIEIRPDGGSYKVSVRPGRVREILPAGGVDGIVMHDVLCDGDSLTDDPPPEIAMTVGQALYVAYTTDNKGYVGGAQVPQLFVGGDTEATVHYQPRDGEGSGGTTGAYNVKIGKLVSTVGGVGWVPYHNSDIEHYHELWTGTNIGTGAGIFKDRNASGDEYRFRRVRGQFGIAAMEDGDDARLDFDAENIGVDGQDVFKPAVVVEGKPTPGKAQFRKIRELVYAELVSGISAAQVRVETVGTEIRVRGNSYAATVRGIHVQDGLVTLIDDDYDADGWWGTVAIYYHPAAGEAEEVEFFFEGGSLKTVKNLGAEIPGIETAPGNATLHIYDTDT